MALSLVSINKVCCSGSYPRLWIVGCLKFKLVPNWQGKGTFVWCKQFLCFVPLAGFSCFGDGHVVLLYCQPLCFLNCCGVWQSLLRRRIISDCRLEWSWGNCCQPFHFINVTRWTVALQLLPWKCLQNDECFMFSFCEKWSLFLKIWSLPDYLQARINPSGRRIKLKRSNLQLFTALPQIPNIWEMSKIIMSMQCDTTVLATVNGASTYDVSGEFILDLFTFHHSPKRTWHFFHKFFSLLSLHVNKRSLRFVIFLAFVQNVITVTIAKEFFTIPRTGKNVSSSLRKMAGYIQRINMTGLRLVAYFSRDKFNVGVLEPKSGAWPSAWLSQTN